MIFAILNRLFTTAVQLALWGVNIWCLWYIRKG